MQRCQCVPLTNDLSIVDVQTGDTLAWNAALALE
jgi:hypothetical protein